jgi:hypothetical protein
VHDLEQAAGHGFKEVAIAGVHLGAWGRDLDRPATLLDLLRAIAGRDLPVRVRISSLEPMECPAELVELVAADVRDGYVSAESARKDYGVALDSATGEPGAEETKKLRDGK